MVLQAPGCESDHPLRSRIPGPALVRHRTKVQYIIRPCTDQMIRNTTYLIGGWEGQATLWASQPD